MGGRTERDSRSQNILRSKSAGYLATPSPANCQEEGSPQRLMSGVGYSPTSITPVRLLDSLLHYQNGVASIIAAI